MKFGIDEDQAEFKAAVAKFLQTHVPLRAVRVMTESARGYDPELWARMANELGLLGVGSPESVGGTGDSLLDLVVVMEELGHALDPSPFLPSIVLVSRALVEAGGHDDWLRELISGTLVASLAVLEADGDWFSTTQATASRRDGDGWRVSGNKRFVLHGATVDDLLVLASGATGPSLLRVRAAALGVSVAPLNSLDPTRPMADVTFVDAHAALVGEPGQGRELLDRVLRRAFVAMASEQLGAAAHALELATDYARIRVQFGRAIGSFQAIKHMLVDVMMDLESARSAVLYAAWAIDSADPEADQLGHLCQAVASEALVAAAKACIQVHGAIGFTWEHDAHLFLKRATGSVQLLGTPAQHRERIAAGLLRPAAN